MSGWRGGVVPAGDEVLPSTTVVALLSRGRDLDVYDAWDGGRGCRCVVKTLRPDRTDDGPARRRLLTEGRLLRRLAHPHVVRAYEVVADPRPAVVLETLPGATLAALVDDLGRLAVTDAALLGVHLASALGYLHTQGWLHLDLKPSNVVVHAGRATLIDLSVARRPGRARRARGTPGYMAPEQRDGRALGPAADVWALGAVLHEVLTGEPAVDEGTGTSGSGTSGSGTSGSGTSGSGTSGVGASYGDGDRPPPVGRMRRLPRPFAALVDGCLDPDPVRRPALPHVVDALAAVAGVDLRAPAPGHGTRWSRDPGPGGPA